MSKSKPNFSDKFTRKASRQQNDAKKRAEVRIMREERTEYVVRGIRVKNAGFTLAELIFVMGFLSFASLIGYVVFHFLSKVW